MEHPYADVFAALDAAGVRFVVVGGFAVVAHGHVRVTVDADLVVDLEPPHAADAVDALLSIGLRPRLPVPAEDFADAVIRATWIRDRGLQVFTFNDPANPLRQVDVFARSPIPWDELWTDAVPVDSGNGVIRVASIEHLVRMKQDSGRPQDLADIEALTDLPESHR